MQGWGKRKRNRGEEGRQRSNILKFIDGITDGIFLSVIPTTILLVKWTRHCMEIAV
jgi:hypothetical protein